MTEKDIERRDKIALKVLASFLETTSDGNAGTDGIYNLQAIDFDNIQQYERVKSAIKKAFMIADLFIAISDETAKIEFIKGLEEVPQVK